MSRWKRAGLFVLAAGSTLEMMLMVLLYCGAVELGWRESWGIGVLMALWLFRPIKRQVVEYWREGQELIDEALGRKQW